MGAIKDVWFMTMWQFFPHFFRQFLFFARNPDGGFWLPTNLLVTVNDYGDGRKQSIPLDSLPIINI